jgi:hypothetical protein
VEQGKRGLEETAQWKASGFVGLPFTKYIPADQIKKEEK